MRLCFFVFILYTLSTIHLYTAVNPADSPLEDLPNASKSSKFQQTIKQAKDSLQLLEAHFE